MNLEFKPRLGEEERRVPIPARASGGSKGCAPNSSPRTGCPPRRPEQPPPGQPPRPSVPAPARTCGLSRGRSSSWAAPPMVFHRSLTIFWQDWRGRRARRAAAERKGGGVGAGAGAGAGRALSTGSSPLCPAPGRPGSGQACADERAAVCGRERGRERESRQPNARRSRCAPSPLTAPAPPWRASPSSLVPPPSFSISASFLVSDSLCFLLLPSASPDTLTHTRALTPADLDSELRLRKGQEKGGRTGPQTPRPAEGQQTAAGGPAPAGSRRGLTAPRRCLCSNFLPGRTRTTHRARGGPQGRPCRPVRRLGGVARRSSWLPPGSRSRARPTILAAPGAGSVGVRPCGLPEVSVQFLGQVHPAVGSPAPGELPAPDPDA